MEEIIGIIRWPIVVIVISVFAIWILREPLKKFIEDVKIIKIKKIEIKRMHDEVFASVEEVRRIKDELEKEKVRLRQITRSIAKIFYLSFQTRNKFPPPVVVMNEMNKEMKEISEFAVEDEVERKQWVERIQKIPQ